MGHLVFQSVDLFADGSVAAEGDPSGQTRRVLETLASVVVGLAAHWMTSFIPSLTSRTLGTSMPFRRVKQEFFVVPPASTTVEISRLVDPRQLVEVEAIADIDTD